jgi:hypothetical protein
MITHQTLNILAEVVGTHETNFKYNYNSLLNKCSSSTRWAGHVARMREKRNAYMILVGKLEGKRPLGRPRRR